MDEHKCRDMSNTCLPVAGGVVLVKVNTYETKLLDLIREDMGSLATNGFNLGWVSIVDYVCQDHQFDSSISVNAEQFRISSIKMATTG